MIELVSLLAQALGWYVVIGVLSFVPWALLLLVVDKVTAKWES